MDHSAIYHSQYWRWPGVCVFCWCNCEAFARYWSVARCLCAFDSHAWYNRADTFDGSSNFISLLIHEPVCVHYFTWFSHKYLSVCDMLAIWCSISKPKLGLKYLWRYYVSRELRPRCTDIFAIVSLVCALDKPFWRHLHARPAIFRWSASSAALQTANSWTARVEWWKCLLRSSSVAVILASHAARAIAPIIVKGALHADCRWTSIVNRQAREFASSDEILVHIPLPRLLVKFGNVEIVGILLHFSGIPYHLQRWKKRNTC